MSRAVIAIVITSVHSLYALDLSSTEYVLCSDRVSIYTAYVIVRAYFHV